MTREPYVPRTSAEQQRASRPIWRELVRAAQRIPPWAIDVAIMAVLLAIGLAQIVEGPGPGPAPGPGGPGGGLRFPTPFSHYVLLSLAALGLVVRSRWPLATLAGVVLFGAPYWVAEPRQLPLLPMVLVALYSVVASSDLSRLQAWAVTVGAALLLGVALVSGGRPVVDPIQSGILMSLVAAILLGDSTRSRRALIVEAERRATDAERSREEHALRRVSEERLEIARELHDIVAHNISLINVQAGVAAHLRGRSPEQIHEAFENIRRVSHSTLDEMRALVGVLREPLDATPGAPTVGLAALDALVASVRNAGVSVRLEAQGEVRALPATVDVSAFRILQEALTNGVRHGAGAGSR